MSTRLVVRRIVVTVSLMGGVFMAVEYLWALLRRLIGPWLGGLDPEGSRRLVVAAVHRAERRPHLRCDIVSNRPHRAIRSRRDDHTGMPAPRRHEHSRPSTGTRLEPMLARLLRRDHRDSVAAIAVGAGPVWRS